jgi:16S rRNA pseudouridine516 synthase
MPLMRLDRMLSAQGFGTRREVKELVRSGEVRVGGKTPKGADVKIDAEKDRIFVSGREVIYKEHIYIMMNKPQGVVSASSDHRQRTIIDLLPASLRRPGLFPAGRLDKDTEGLLIITDDGPFAHRILSPVSHVGKKYLVLLDSPADNADIEAFKKGVILSDGYECLPALLETGGGRAFVTLSEGKYHQIKRMFEARQKKVLYLKRLSMGGLILDESLEPGEFRELMPWEIAGIKPAE